MLGIKTSLIETTEDSILKDYKKDCDYLLFMEKVLVEYFFDWLRLTQIENALLGKGTLHVGGERFEIILKYSPCLPLRFDRIWITNQNIVYNSAIHVYQDLSLCLYHPTLDKPLFKMIPLVKMIPWITEWCVHYSEWKKYKVWLGREINH